MGFRNLAACIVVTVLLGLSLTCWANAPKNEVEEARILLPVELPGDLTWKKCGTWNGYYFWADDSITLCEENLTLGIPTARFIYLHELGHDFTFNLGMSYGRWRGNYEAAADEFAAVMAILQQHPGDILDMAVAFERWGKRHPRRDGDPHPTMHLRAEAIKALYYGYMMPWSSYGEHWRETLHFWGDRIREYNDGHP